MPDHTMEKTKMPTFHKPLIGLTGRRAPGSILGGPSGFADAPLDIYMSEYASSIQKAGGIPVHLAVDSVPDEIVGRLDALVLVGGEDVDPRRYGQAPGQRTATIDPVRDAFEFGAFAAALDAGIPVLGICRGLQLINVASGGTLIADLEIGTGESHASYAYPRAHRAHAVDFSVGSVPYRVLGPRVLVNSFHHQAIDRAGAAVTVTGRAPDGVVESIELTNAPVVGVQWHPETFGGDPLFTWLVTEAGRISIAEEAA